jgi:hypothetical protein
LGNFNALMRRRNTGSAQATDHGLAAERCYNHVVCRGSYGGLGIRGHWFGTHLDDFSVFSGISLNLSRSLPNP